MTPKKVARKYSDRYVDTPATEEEIQEIEQEEKAFEETAKPVDKSGLSQVETEYLFGEGKPQVQPAKSVSLVAFAPFDFLEKHYEKGDAFTLPEGYKRDLASEEFRGTARKNLGPGEEAGMAVIEQSGRLSILPVKEA